MTKIYCFVTKPIITEGKLACFSADWVMFLKQMTDIEIDGRSREAFVPGTVADPIAFYFPMSTENVHISKLFTSSNLFSRTPPDSN